MNNSPFIPHYETTPLNMCSSEHCLLEFSLAGLYAVHIFHIYFALGMKQHVFLIVILSAFVVSSQGKYPNSDDNSLSCRGNEYHLFLSF